MKAICRWSAKTLRKLAIKFDTFADGLAVRPLRDASINRKPRGQSVIDRGIDYVEQNFEGKFDTESARKVWDEKLQKARRRDRNRNKRST